MRKPYQMSAERAEQILRENVETLPEPLRSAVEFSLANWYKLTGTTNPAIEAKNFLGGLRVIPFNRHELSEENMRRLREAMSVLRSDASIWLSSEDLPHEQWRDIDGYEGLYQISIFARVKSLFVGKPRILKDGDNGRGYRVVNLSKNSKHKMFTLHTLVARHFIPNPENKPEVNHYYGKDDNCVWALEWATASENGLHAYKFGLKRAERPATAKLTDDDVQFIRRKYKPNDIEFGANVLAKKFGVDASTIRRAAYGETYRASRGRSQSGDSILRGDGCLREKITAVGLPQSRDRQRKICDADFPDAARHERRRIQNGAAPLDEKSSRQRGLAIRSLTKLTGRLRSPLMS